MIPKRELIHLFLMIDSRYIFDLRRNNIVYD